MRRLTIVCDLKGEDLLEFQRNVQKHRVKSGQLIYSEGEKCAGLYIIMHGRVKLYYESIDGKEQIVDIIGPGAVFGDVSLTANSRYDVSAEAYEDGVYCSIPLDYYQQLVQSKPQVAIRLLTVLESQLTKSRKMIRDLSLKRARQRMASIIVRLANEEGRDAPGGMEIKLPVTVQTLAYMSGLTQETASRVLSEFRKTGVIALKNRRLKILQYEKLKENAEMG
ncbi:CRP/FNR family transcriptional regulator [Desulfohalotomaculum tongense]|uniref:cyclic nucleotide-binding domain-containing protein n=1 Tax=Desulforadius tongensis TaxID=1216062 RepID=UPI001956F37D|nr:CRP/FNR family transcriptional regulator [Desulforadius tongensis]